MQRSDKTKSIRVRRNISVILCNVNIGEEVTTMLRFNISLNNKKTNPFISFNI